MAETRTLNLSIDDCDYDKETQELKSRIGISYTLAPAAWRPPKEIHVKGKTCIVIFRFMAHDPFREHTIYGNPQLVTETTKELTDKQKGIVLIMPWVKHHVPVSFGPSTLDGGVGSAQRVAGFVP
jgi:hypothetical protein